MGRLSSLGYFGTLLQFNTFPPSFVLPHSEYDAVSSMRNHGRRGSTARGLSYHSPAASRYRFDDPAIGNIGVGARERLVDMGFDDIHID